MVRTGMTHRQRARAGAVAVVPFVALMGGLLAGVAGGPAPAGAATTSTTSVKLPASVKAQADKSLLRLSDLPSGWVAAGTVSAPTSSSPWSKQLASCAAVPTSIAAIKPTKISSPDFTSGDRTAAVEDSVLVYPTAAEAKAAWHAMAGAKTPSCMNRIGSAALRASVQNEAGAGATVGNISIAALGPGTYEPGQTGYTVTIPLVSGDRQLTITSTEIEIVHGRFVHQLTFNGNGVAFPALLQVHVVRQVEARD